LDKSCYQHELPLACLHILGRKKRTLNLVRPKKNKWGKKAEKHKKTETDRMEDEGDVEIL